MGTQLAPSRKSSPSSRFFRVVPVMVTLAAFLCVAGTGNGSAANPSGVSTELARSFALSARHWNVPQQVLMAIGWVESHWEQRDGVPSLDEGYGIMHITDRSDGTLARAVQLTGLSADAIKRFPEANIEAGAALLSDISRKADKSPISLTELAAWYPVVEVYSGASDPTVQAGYANEVFDVVQKGEQETLASGEVLVLAPSAELDLPSEPKSAPASTDYPPALWVAANPNNYTVERPYPPLDTIIIHDTEGSYASAISWFQNPASGVSAHYVVRSSDGQITQMVRNADTAYHAGVWDYNVRAIGIEHEGYEGQQGWYTEPMYEASAALVQYLTDEYGIKKDRAHVIGHYQVPDQSHTDPGQYWDWTHYMSLVRRDSQMAALVDNTDAGFAPVPAQIDPQHYWWTYDGGYDGSNTYGTTSVTYQSSSVNSATWTAQLPSTGYYDVYAFIPYVDNSTPDTASAKYEVQAANGTSESIVSQSAITDVGSGSWANIGKYYFTGGQQASVSLSDWTGETGKNVWFDAVMWIPSLIEGTPPTPVPSRTPAPPAPSATSTPTSTPVATWTPGPCGMTFSDLPDTYWAYSYISYLYCDGVVSGYGDGTFRPNGGSTRGQFAKMLTLALGWQEYNPIYPDFTDVQPGSTYYAYIEAAFTHGAVRGYADGSFKPNNPVTRAQAAKMLVLGKGWDVVSPPTPSFGDVPRDHWAYPYVETSAGHGVISGYGDGTFRPDQPVSRAQLSKMVALTAQAAGPAMPLQTRVRTPSSSAWPSVTMAPKEVPAQK